jgi:DNA-nicking Smr family endonuclease
MVQDQDPFDSAQGRPLRIPIDGVLDLHAFAPRDIPSVVEEYLNEAHAAGLRDVRLIHGRGMGVQRGIVQQTLERHPLVLQFFDDAASHLGATIAILKA